MTLESKLKEIKERAEKATTMTNYKGESHPSDSCTDPSVCMAKTDVPMLLEVVELLQSDLMFRDDGYALRDLEPAIIKVLEQHYGK